MLIFMLDKYAVVKITNKGSCRMLQEHDRHTVWRGSISATSIAMLMASKEGFKITGNSSGWLDFERFGFIVSKQIICSKQSFISRRSSTFIAWFSSELVKIWKLNTNPISISRGFYTRGFFSPVPQCKYISTTINLKGCGTAQILPHWQEFY